jgi:hypothetical protein
MSAFTNQDPADYRQDPAAMTLHRMNVYPEPDQSATPSTVASGHDSTHVSSAPPKTTTTETPQSPEDSASEILQPEESETTHRARHAANQRHAKARKASQRANSKKNRAASSASASASEADTNADEKKRVNGKHECIFWAVLLGDWATGGGLVLPGMYAERRAFEGISVWSSERASGIRARHEMLMLG